MTLRLLTRAALVLFFAAGCQRVVTVAEQDARERESPLIHRALEHEQAGDLNGAIQTYEEVLQETPNLVSAHFHLALLLQDYRKDYMGAIYHYRQYERLRPDTEKKALLHDRARVCQQLLAAQILSGADVAISRKQSELVGEIDKLNKRLSQVEGEKSALQEQKADIERQVIEQKSESERLRRLLDRMLPSSAATPAAEESRPRSILPRLDPAAVAPAAVTPPPTPPRLTVTEIPAKPTTAKPVVADTEPPPLLKSVVLDPDPGAASSIPAPPVTAATRTYVVQPGDSVYRIAERVYGDAEQWKKIRDANKDRLGPGNQVRAGQVLVIP